MRLPPQPVAPVYHGGICYEAPQATAPLKSSRRQRRILELIDFVRAHARLPERRQLWRALCGSGLALDRARALVSRLEQRAVRTFAQAEPVASKQWVKLPTFNSSNPFANAGFFDDLPADWIYQDLESGGNTRMHEIWLEGAGKMAAEALLEQQGGFIMASHEGQGLLWSLVVYEYEQDDRVYDRLECHINSMHIGSDAIMALVNEAGEQFWVDLEKRQVLPKSPDDALRAVKEFLNERPDFMSQDLAKSLKEIRGCAPDQLLASLKKLLDALAPCKTRHSLVKTAWERGLECAWAVRAGKDRRVVDEWLATDLGWILAAFGQS